MFGFSSAFWAQENIHEPKDPISGWSKLLSLFRSLSLYDIEYLGLSECADWYAALILNLDRFSHVVNSNRCLKKKHSQSSVRSATSHGIFSNNKHSMKRSQPQNIFTYTRSHFYVYNFRCLIFYQSHNFKTLCTIYFTIANICMYIILSPKQVKLILWKKFRQLSSNNWFNITTTPIDVTKYI